MELLWEDGCLPGIRTVHSAHQKGKKLLFKKKKLYLWQETKGYKAYFKTAMKHQTGPQQKKANLTFRFPDQ